MSEHWPGVVDDTYLGVIYCCCWCGWRLTECKCPPDPPGWNLNRYPQPVEAALYEMGPIMARPSSFVRFDEDLS